MNMTAGGLKELHQLHIKLQTVQEKLQRGPKQVRARRQYAERKQAELEAQTEQLKQLKMAADRKSLQLKTNENKIAELRARLNMAGSNREFDITKSQIEADTMANSVLEDEILEVLDKVDQTQAAIKQVEQEYAAAKAEEERVAGEVAAAEPVLGGQASELEGALRSAESHLPGKILEGYRRLVHAHGAGALASVENRACTACYAILSPQHLVEVNSGQITLCRSCGRLLYRSEED